MQKKLFILLMGCIPFLIGRAQDWLMMNYFPPLMLISILMLLFWGVLSVFSLQMMNGDKQALFLLNAPAALDLILILCRNGALAPTGSI